MRLDRGQFHHQMAAWFAGGPDAISLLRQITNARNALLEHPSPGDGRGAAAVAHQRCASSRALSGLVGQPRRRTGGLEEFVES